MKFKKFVLRHRYLFLFFLIIAAPMVILAAVDLPFYDILPGDVNKKIYQRQSDNLSVSNKAVCIDASDSAHAYFIGNKTKTEIESFFTSYYNDPSKFNGVTIKTGCCVDEVCDGESGENCSNCADDCGPCATPCNGTVVDARDGRTYNIVTIGEQCWMQQNMNIGTTVSVSSNQTNNSTIENHCYSSYPYNCGISPGSTSLRGGLYQWDEAMQYSTTEKSQGICPPGWHIPTAAEFAALSSYYGGDSTAGGSLKVLVDWETPIVGGSNTADFLGITTGLASGGVFSGLTYNANYWTSTASDSTNSVSRNLQNSTTAFNSTNRSKQNSLAVRCIRNIAASAPIYSLTYSVGYTGHGTVTGNLSQSVGYNGSGTAVTAVADPGYKFDYWSDGSNANPRTDINVTRNISVTASFSRICPASFTDSRDGNVYHSEYIAGKCWMTGNLKYLPTVQYTSDSSNSSARYYVYNYIPTWFNPPKVSDAKANSNYTNFGVLYNWNAASTACPSGWRLPSNGEVYLNSGYNIQELAGTDYTHLKIHNVPHIGDLFWTGTGASGEGDDLTGFGATPGGWYTASTIESDRFQFKGTRAYFWGATECKLTTGCGSNNSQYHLVYKIGAGSFTDFWMNQNGFSVRCVKE